ESQQASPSDLFHSLRIKQVRIRLERRIMSPAFPLWLIDPARIFRNVHHQLCYEKLRIAAASKIRMAEYGAKIAKHCLCHGSATERDCTAHRCRVEPLPFG